MKLYLASKYSDMEKLNKIGTILENMGHSITSKWLKGKEEGQSRSDAALMDADDVDRADGLVLFTEPKGTYTTGGGRHWEFGYAYGKNKKCFVVGDKEHIFCHLPDVVVVDNLHALMDALEQ